MIRYLPQIRDSKIVRYLVAGALVAALYFLVLLVLIKHVAAPTPVAILLAYLSTAVVRFLIHRSWVFSADYNLVHSHFIKYVVMMACSYVLNVGITELLANIFLFTAVYVAFCSAITASLFAYVMSVKWVYK
jgi:putative flippase GtrA